MQARESFDYIIVGAGSAGCTLAERLTENKDCRVLLLEAGGWDTDPWIHIPLGWGRIFQNRLHDWGYFGEPEPNVGGRAVECARGKVIGGSSSINAMTYVRGHRSDYDRWASSGLAGWSYADVLPYFKRQESWEGGEDSYRGGSGPMAVRASRYKDPLADAYIAAGLEAGHPWTDDYNGAEQHGFGKFQTTIRNGRRESGATAYLAPARRRRNLTIRTRALVHRVELEGDRARSVKYSVGNSVFTASAHREIILSAGVINTPQILMLSGIGEAAHLQSHGIRTLVASPGVGSNLQDHLVAMAAYRRNGSGPFRQNMRLDRIAIELAKAQFFGRGFATDLPSGVMAFIKTDQSLKAPDTQLLFHAGALAAGPYLPPFKPAFPDGFSCRAVLLRPESRGRIALAGADPKLAPRIHWNFLGTDGDRIAMRKSFKTMREIAQQKAMRPFVEREIIPSEVCQTDSDIDTHIAKTAITAHHPLGTCRMGLDGDDHAVVDLDLNVRGVRGLRVVDASVMPDMIGGNINACVVMIAERAADIIGGRDLLSPDPRFAAGSERSAALSH